MTTDFDAPIPDDDAIARAARDGLRRIAGSHPPAALAWDGVQSGARHVRQRRIAALVAACAIVLTTAGVAVAATGNNGNHVNIAGQGETPTTASPSTTTTATTTTQPSTTVPLPLPAPGNTPTVATPDPIPPQTPQGAQAGDFTGLLQHWRDTCNPCDSSTVDKGITLTIRNITNHPIDLSTSAPRRVAVVCATGVNENGVLTRPLPQFATGDIFVNEVFPAGGSPYYDTPGTSLAPGAVATNSAATAFTFAGEPAGIATCMGAIVATSDGTWSRESLSVVAPLTYFQTYSFELVDPPTTTTAPSETTTTVPAPTTTTP